MDELEDDELPEAAAALQASGGLPLARPPKPRRPPRPAKKMSPEARKAKRERDLAVRKAREEKIKEREREQKQKAIEKVREKERKKAQTGRVNSARSDLGKPRKLQTPLPRRKVGNNQTATDEQAQTFGVNIRREPPELPTYTIGVVGKEGVEMVEQCLEILRKRFEMPLNSEAVFTAEQIEKVEEMARLGHSNTAIAAYFGIDKSSFARYLSLGRQVLLKMREGVSITLREEMLAYLSLAHRRGEMNSEQHLLKYVHDAMAYDWRAASWLLARRFPQEWGSGREQKNTKTSIDVTVKAGVLIAPQPSATPEEWQNNNQRTLNVDPGNLIDAPVQKVGEPDLLDEEATLAELDPDLQ